MDGHQAPNRKNTEIKTLSRHAWSDQERNIPESLLLEICVSPYCGGAPLYGRITLRVTSCEPFSTSAMPSVCPFASMIWSPTLMAERAFPLL